MKKLFLGSRVSFLILSVLIGGTFLLLSAAIRPAAPSTFDWDDEAHDWPAQSLMQTYTGVGSPATTFTYTFSGYTQRIEQGKPTRSYTITGGLNPAEYTLFYSADFRHITETITLTIDLSIESFNVEFLLMDIDDPNLGTGIDRVEVSGVEPLGAIQLPALTELGPCVDVTANTAIGICDSPNLSDQGNVQVSFNSPTGLQQIRIVFSEGSVVVDPDAHGIALHDIYFEPGAPEPTSTPSLTPTVSPTPTVTPTPTETPIGGVTPTPSQTPTVTPTTEPERPELYLPVILKQ